MARLLLLLPASNTFALPSLVQHSLVFAATAAVLPEVWQTLCMLPAGAAGAPHSTTSMPDAVAEEDAFAAGDAANPDEDDVGGGRRRASVYSSAGRKHSRAQAILDAGPDAIVMDFEDGQVPRQ